MAKNERWLAEPVESDYGAAAQHLTLVMAEDRSRAVATRFGGAPILRHRANDLLVRGGLGECALTVADGYHRICASFSLDEDAAIPCQMVDVPG